MNNGGTKFDSEKPRMELLPPEALEEVAKVLTFGAKKYEDHNWRKGFSWSRLYGAALRHIFSHMSGENLDPESGESHLSHAAACILFLITHEKKGLGKDDRVDREHTSVDMRNSSSVPCAQKGTCRRNCD